MTDAMQAKTKKYKWRPKVIIRYVFLTIFAIWCLFPILWLLNMSLKTKLEVLAMPPKWLFIPTFENYSEVLHMGDFRRYFINSLVVGTCSTLLSLLLGVPASYILAKFRFSGRKHIDFWVLSTRMVPPITILIPYFLMFRILRLNDTYFALVLMHTAVSLALVIWVMKGFFLDVPDELQEAALVDGCTYWGAFTKVIFPMVATGVTAVGILAFLTSWNEFLFSLVLSSTRVKTAPVGIYNFVSFQEVAWGPLSAAGMVILIPVLVFISLAQKELIRGLTFGAVKE